MPQAAVVEIVLIISAVIVAARNIYGFFREPKKAYDNYQKKHKEDTINIIREVFREEMKPFQTDLVERTEILKLVLATQIERLYWQGLKDKTVYSYNLETLNLLYESYRSLGGNGYIEHLMTQMRNWTVVQKT